MVMKRLRCDVGVRMVQGSAHSLHFDYPKLYAYSNTELITTVCRRLNMLMHGLHENDSTIMTDAPVSISQNFQISCVYNGSGQVGSQ